MGTLRRTCATVPQPSELRSGVVRAVGRRIAILDGVHVVQGEGSVLGVFCSPFSQWEMPQDRWRWNVSDSYTKTWQHFRSANVSLENSIHGLFGDMFTFKITAKHACWLQPAATRPSPQITLGRIIIIIIIIICTSLCVDYRHSHRRRPSVIGPTCDLDLLTQWPQNNIIIMCVSYLNVL